MGSNLPPGVTPGDIDNHYEHAHSVMAVGTVSVGVEVEVPEWMTDKEIKEALRDEVSVSSGQIVDAEIVEKD